MKAPDTVPAVTVWLLLSLLAPSAVAVAGTSPPRDIIIVYKTHFDIGYTQLARDVAHQYRTEMTDGVLEAIEQNAHQPKEKQFVWTLSGWPILLPPDHRRPHG